MRTKPAAMDPWEARFEAQLQDDAYARKIFARLIRKGADRRRLVLLLEATTDPNSGWRFERSIDEGWARRKELSTPFVLHPPKREAEHLAQSLRDTASEIRHFWLRTIFAFSPYSKTALDIASILDQHAKTLDEVKWKLIMKRLGYKAFWQHLTLALLCLELQVPDQSSYVEASQLAAVALRAWNYPGTSKTFTPNAIRKRYERFCKRQAGRGGLAFLELFLKIIKPSQ